MVPLEGRQILGRTYAAGMMFNVTYLMYAVLVPIDAVHRGFPLWEVGVLTAAPGFLQLPARILSGPMTDVFGEPLMIRSTFLSALLAGMFAIFVQPPVIGLALGQLAVGIARGLYWTAAQSLVSRQPVDRAQAMGLFTTFTKGGALIGIFASGLAADVLGLTPAFAITSGLAVIGLILTWPIPTRVLNRGSIKMKRAMAGLWPAAKRPLVLLYGSAAFLCAMPQALAQSFYPVYLLHLHTGRTMAGAITAFMSLGMTLSGLTGAVIMHRFGAHRMVTMAALTMVIGFAITPIHSIVVSSIGIFAAGWASGWLNVAFLTRVSEKSPQPLRGTNLAMTQVYFVIAMMVTPVLSGWASQTFGFIAGFGFPAILAALLMLLFVIFAKRSDRPDVIEPAV